MTDISIFHVKKVTDGDHDFDDHTSHSSVYWDGKTYYYDLTGTGVSKQEFVDFVVDVFAVGEVEVVSVCDYDKERKTFKAWVD